ncbi:hypothetical protein FXO38_13788 [Capsicum annuum]|nr:hypothetical protein FXO37_15386 [Capsicum annuum]KAF3657196.1 hypothetical protein FXO38_13788 [Capsicum annuum]
MTRRFCLYTILKFYWHPPLAIFGWLKHLVDVEYCPPGSCEGPHYPLEAAKEKEAAQRAPSTHRTLEYHESMEEEMMRGLQQLGWKKVDVSFHSAFWPFFAHSNIYEESSDESSDGSSSEHDNSSAEEDAVVKKAPVAAYQKQDSSDESSSDDDVRAYVKEPVAGQPKTVKNTSDSFEETNSDEDNSDSDSGADKGKAVAVSKKKVESSGDNCGEEVGWKSIQLLLRFL